MNLSLFALFGPRTLAAASALMLSSLMVASAVGPAWNNQTAATATQGSVA